MRPTLASLLATAILVSCTTAAEPNAAPEPAPQAERTCFLVHLNCAPSDNAAIEKTLELAKSLCGKQSDVTLFIDLNAVVLADRELTALSQERRTKVAALFAAAEKHGAKILVCPHCAKEFGIRAERIRNGARFTTKEELEELTRKADTVFEGNGNQKQDRTITTRYQPSSARVLVLRHG